MSLQLFPTRWARLATMAAVATLAIAGAPVPADAGHPTMLWAEVFGDVDTRNDPVKGAVLHAWGAPFGRGVSPTGLSWVRGQSGVGGSFVDIVVDDADDATPSVTKTVVAESSTLPDGSANPDKGAFFTSVNVTDLGTHTATGDPAAGDAGSSVLTFSITSRLASGARSQAVGASLTKYAGSRYDTFKPQFQTKRGTGGDTGNRVVGSGLWCHKLPKRPFWSNAFNTPPATAVQQLEELRGNRQEDPRDTRRWDSFWSGCSDNSTFPWRGFSANVTDEGDPKVTFGIASEIGEVEVTVTGGPYTEPHRLEPEVLRGGTGASIGVTLHIDDFEPTYYVGRPSALLISGSGVDEIPTGPYTIKVKFQDAWGNNFEWTPMSSFNVCKC